MSWRGMAGGIAAARQGHDVIMSPVDHAYFDYYQGDAAGEPLAIGGFLPLERVYAFEPVPDVLTAPQSRHILGAQGNLWTEYITTPEHLEYMLLPRLLALAEVAWTPRDSRSWASFQARLPRALAQLDRLGANYRIPEVRGLDGDRLVLDTVVTVQLSGLHPRGVIRYTIDGTEPGPESPAYARPITLRLRQPAQLRARLVLPNGRRGPISAGTFRRTTLRSAQPVDDSTLRPGLLYRYFEARLTSVRDLDSAAVLRTETVDRVALRGNERDEHFALLFDGFLRVPESGVYRFSLLSDDGAVLTIGNEIVVDHDGPHGPTEKHGEIALAAGLHRFTVRYFQAGGGKTLALGVVPPGGERMDVPAEWFRYDNAHKNR
jgi:hexosaminidase